MLVPAGTALAAGSSSPTLTSTKAIQIAASDPRIGPLQDANPGAYWTATYAPASGVWTAVFHSKDGKRRLARFTIADKLGTVLTSQVTAHLGPPQLSKVKAAAIAAKSAALQHWLSLYHRPSHSVQLGDDRVWTVSYYDGGNEIAEVQIPDSTARPTSVWTGPQVGWMMTRGLKDSYGRKVASAWVLIPMCLLFIGGLLDWKRLRSWRTLDVTMIVSMVVSLEFFNRGDIFISTPLIYPPLIYLTARLIAIGFGHRPRRFEIGERHMLVLIGLIFALMGFRMGLNNRDSNVIDVGYASVAGASRLLDGVLPYGHMPNSSGADCGGKYANGDPIGHVQSNGRCESPVDNGDTYGPVVYIAYAPAVEAFGWSGRWDSLTSAHVAAAAFDILAVVGLFVAGWRLWSPRTGVLLAFGWAANPFTAYSLNMNSNDALVGAAVAWLLAVLSVPVLRGVMLSVAGLTKLGPLALVPLFSSLRGRWPMLIAFVVTTLVLFSMLLLDSNGLRLVWDRTIAYQNGRVTPMSIWTLGSFHPGWPDLKWLQTAAQVAVGIGVCLLAIFPRGQKDAVAVAALGGAAVIGVQMVAAYWFYPYVCWWLPLVLVGFLLPRPELPTRSA
jgi:hypothetical protein